jgi:CubicO group peptidase (beta-lactamase class C family)
MRRLSSRRRWITGIRTRHDNRRNKRGTGLDDSSGNLVVKAKSPGRLLRDSRFGVREAVFFAWLLGRRISWPQLLVLFLSMAALGLGAGVSADDVLDRRELVEAFQQADVVPKQGGFIQPLGEFPKLVWDRPFLVRAAWGDFPLAVRWFDPEGSEVQQAERPGRYGVYLEGRPTGGPVIRRAKTFFFIDPAAATEFAGEPLWKVPRDAMLGVSQPAWDRHRPHLQAFVDQALVRALTTSEEAAILGAALAEWQVSDDPDYLDTPNVRHQEYHLAIRRKLGADEVACSPLNRPMAEDPPASILVEGSTREAGFAVGLPDKLRAYCGTWLRESGEPFTIVVARRGVVVFHEGFGERDGRPVDEQTLYPLFSLTKTLAGTMLGMFMDQGLLALDDPVGRVLGDFPTSGRNAITFRACMMHVTGLQGHSRWRGLDNPWFDNVVAHGLETLEPAYAYSGVPYDLTGIAMQTITGKVVPRLFHDHLFAPLEMQGARITGLGTGAELRALDLAKLGQLWLNRGAYGGHRFFGDAVWEELLPQAYEDRFPGLAPQAADYGIGTQWVGRRHPRAGEDGRPKDAMLPSHRTLGHGSFSGTVLRVDLEHDMVVVVGRFAAGPDHQHHVEELLALLVESLREDGG